MKPVGTGAFLCLQIYRPDVPRGSILTLIAMNFRCNIIQDSMYVKLELVANKATMSTQGL